MSVAGISVRMVERRLGLNPVTEGESKSCGSLGIKLEHNPPSEPL